MDLGNQGGGPLEMARIDCGDVYCPHVHARKARDRGLARKVDKTSWELTWLGWEYYHKRLIEIDGQKEPGRKLNDNRRPRVLAFAVVGETVQDATIERLLLEAGADQAGVTPDVIRSFSNALAIEVRRGVSA